MHHICYNFKHWMDEVRSGPAYKYTTPWHYMNIEPGGTYTPAPGGDIIIALNNAYARLHAIYLKQVPIYPLSTY